MVLIRPWSGFALLAALIGICNAAGAQNDSVIAIPMTYDRYLYVQPILSDTISGRFMFDMGAQLTMLDSAFLAQHHIQFTHTQTAIMLGYGNRKETAVYSTDTMHFNLHGHHFASSPNVIYPFNNILGDIHGLLGPTTFGGRMLAIDYTAGRLRVLPTEARDTLDSDRYERIPFTINATNFITIPLAVILDSVQHMTISGRVHIDTGNPGSLTLNASSEQLDHWNRQIPRKLSYQAALLGLSGGGNFLNIKTQSLRLGEALIPAHQITIHTASTHQDTTLIGAIGNALLCQFGSVIFDMENNALYLPRGKQFINKDRVHYSGFRLSRVNKWFVNGLSPHPTAVRDGDIITHIDGHSIDTLTQEERDSYFGTPDRHYTLIILRSGKTLEIPITNLNDKTLWH